MRTLKGINGEIPLLKVGDKYIKISPYGGITTGTVMSIFYTTHIQVIDGEKYTYKVWSFRNDVGIILEVDGNDGEIYKLEQ
jgi:hypothetical protein